MDKFSFYILGIILCTIFSIYVHEYGHILMAKLTGHSFYGFVYSWYGVGAKIDITKNPRDLWKIALAGLLATAALAAVSYPFINFWLMDYLFMLNFIILIMNSIPIGPTDGRQIITGLRTHRTLPASQ